MMVLIERHPDGYIAYPLGLRGVVIGQGDSRDAALANLTSAIQFHAETFGRGVLADESRPLEVFLAEVRVE